MLNKIQLPIIYKDNIEVVRCVATGEWMFGKNTFELHSGNLRIGKKTNRYAKLFPFLYVSYWADSIDTARAEMMYHYGDTDFVSFHASYHCQDASEHLRIVDGTEINFHKIIEKDELGISLEASEKELIQIIADTQPDCLLYQSKRNIDGTNYLFFENGFRKLCCNEINLNVRCVNGVISKRFSS